MIKDNTNFCARNRAVATEKPMNGLLRQQKREYGCDGIGDDMKYQNNAMMKVYDFITEKIKSKEWTYGDKIWTEAEFCAHLKVSRVSVRQAIEKLVTMSILRKVQGSGTYVENADKHTIMAMNIFHFSAEDLLNILNFRLYFEAGNARMFIAHADEEDYEALENALAIMQEEGTKHSDRYYYHDNQFHSIIARGTKNPFVEKISELVAETLVQHQHSIHSMIGSTIGIGHHERILRHIKARNAEAASIEMQHHILTTTAAIEEYVARSKEENGDE